MLWQQSIICGAGAIRAGYRKCCDANSHSLIGSHAERDQPQFVRSDVRKPDCLEFDKVRRRVTVLGQLLDRFRKQGWESRVKHR